MKQVGLIVGLLCLLMGCASIAPSRATMEIRSFLTALRDNNRAGIEARIDRAALSLQISEVSRAIGEAESKRFLGDGLLGGIIGAVAGSALEFAGPSVVDPAILMAIARRAGLLADSHVPNQFQAQLYLRNLPDGRVCVPDPQTRTCLLFFTDNVELGWQLTSVDPAVLRSRLLGQ
jgi:hypothetical protein